MGCLLVSPSGFPWHCCICVHSLGILRRRVLDVGCLSLWGVHLLRVVPRGRWIVILGDRRSSTRRWLLGGVRGCVAMVVRCVHVSDRQGSTLRDLYAALIFLGTCHVGSKPLDARCLSRIARAFHSS
jgi:hypothetical protein